MKDTDKTKDQQIHELEELLRNSEDSKESARYYRMLFNNTNDAAFASQLTEDSKLGRFIEVNDIACRRLGYTRKELMDMSAVDIGVPERTGESPLLMKEFLAKAHIVVEISSHLLDLSIARDIAGRKQAEAALRKHQEHLEVTLCSGYNMQDATRRFADKGLVGSPQKPYSMVPLNTCIREACGF